VSGRTKEKLDATTAGSTRNSGESSPGGIEVFGFVGRNSTRGKTIEGFFSTATIVGGGGYGRRFLELVLVLCLFGQKIVELGNRGGPQFADTVRSGSRRLRHIAQTKNRYLQLVQVASATGPTKDGKECVTNQKQNKLSQEEQQL